MGIKKRKILSVTVSSSDATAERGARGGPLQMNKRVRRYTGHALVNRSEGVSGSVGEEGRAEMVNRQCIPHVIRLAGHAFIAEPFRHTPGRTTTKPMTSVT